MPLNRFDFNVKKWKGTTWEEESEEWENSSDEDECKDACEGDDEDEDKDVDDEEDKGASEGDKKDWEKDEEEDDTVKEKKLLAKIIYPLARGATASCVLYDLMGVANRDIKEQNIGFEIVTKKKWVDLSCGSSVHQFTFLDFLSLMAMPSTVSLNKKNWLRMHYSSL